MIALTEYEFKGLGDSEIITKIANTFIEVYQAVNDLITSEGLKRLPGQCAFDCL